MKFMLLMANDGRTKSCGAKWWKTHFLQLEVDSIQNLCLDVKAWNDGCEVFEECFRCVSWRRLGQPSTKRSLRSQEDKLSKWT